MGSIGLLSLTASVLSGVGPADPLVLGCATAVVLVAALAAAALPARRATAIDPLSTLRTD